jgi:hypothetical protein
MVVGTIFEVGRSGLEVAGLINTAERALQHWIEEWKSKIFMRAPTERSAGALEGSGVASRDCKTNGERDQRGRKGTDRQNRLVAARVAAPTLMP